MGYFNTNLNLPVPKSAGELIVGIAHSLKSSLTQLRPLLLGVREMTCPSELTAVWGKEADRIWQEARREGGKVYMCFLCLWKAVLLMAVTPGRLFGQMPGLQSQKVRPSVALKSEFRAIYL